MCGPEARGNGDERFFFDLNVESPLHTSDKPCIKYSNLAQCALFASIVNEVSPSIPLKGSLTFLSTIPMHRESDGANSSRTLAGNTMRAPITLAVILTFFVTKPGRGKTNGGKFGRKCGGDKVLKIGNKQFAMLMKQF